MSFYDDFVKEDESGGYSSYPSHDETAHILGAKNVHYEILDSTRGWHVVQYVYEKDGEFVSVEYEEASGDVETEYLPDYKAVKPQTVTVTTYVAV